MINKAIEQINEDDLQQLIDNCIIEKKTLEYKSILPTNSDSDKKEFLADVSSFANASGGDLIFGIEEDRSTGAPKKLGGLSLTNVDQEILRLDQIIRNSIEPRLPSYDIQPITLKNRNIVIVIRIQRSWIAPHRVSFKGSNKFFTRSTNGKYEMDVGELRQSFTLSETIIDKIRWFRKDRIAYIETPEFNVNFIHGPKLALHLIPFNSFKPGINYDISKLIEKRKEISFRPIYVGSWNIEFNFDGVISYNDKNGKIRSYVQIYRNGILEAVSVNLLDLYGKSLIPSILYEQELMKSLSEYLNVVKELNIELPIFLLLSLLNVKGLKMAVGNSLKLMSCHPIDRNQLILNEVKIEKYNSKPEKILQTCFNAIWNSCGYAKSFNYDKENRWVGHK